MKSKSKIILFVVVLAIGFIICTSFKDRILDIIFMSRTYGPLTLGEIQQVAQLPIHNIDDDGYQNLEQVYYFFDYQPELTLATYFTVKNQKGESIRVAKMLTYNLQVGLVPSEITNREVNIKWASHHKGGCV